MRFSKDVKAGESQCRVKFSLWTSFSKWIRLMRALLFHRKGSSTFCSLSAASADGVTILGNVLLHQYLYPGIMDKCSGKKKNFPLLPATQFQTQVKIQGFTGKEGWLTRYQHRWRTEKLKPGTSLASLELQGYRKKIVLSPTSTGRKVCGPEKGAPAAAVLLTPCPSAAVEEVVIHITELAQRALNSAIIEK